MPKRQMPLRQKNKFSFDYWLTGAFSPPEGVCHFLTQSLYESTRQDYCNSVEHNLYYTYPISQAPELISHLYIFIENLT